MKKSNIKVVEIENGVITVIYTSGARRYYDDSFVPATVLSFMAEHIDNAVTTVSRNESTVISYCDDNTYAHALELTRVYAEVYFGGKKIRTNEILKDFLPREDVNIVFSTKSESYKVFYNGARHHIYSKSLLYKVIKALNLIVEKV